MILDRYRAADPDARSSLPEAVAASLCPRPDLILRFGSGEESPAPPPAEDDPELQTPGARRPETVWLDPTHDPHLLLREALGR